MAADGSPPPIGHNGGPSIDLPEKLLSAFMRPDGSWVTETPQGVPVRYRVLYGGRGGAKSWGVARILIGLAAEAHVRVLCAREFQVSIADSVHRLLVDTIDAMGLAAMFVVTDRSIYCPVTGSEFTFKGLRRNIREIKSLEGIDIVWVEEAQAVSRESWQILRPTIRKGGSEIWATFNPDGDEDPTYSLFVLKPPPGTISVKVGWQDNPWFPPELERERQADLANDDDDAYMWIWEGMPRRISDAIIFRRRVEIRPFEEPAMPGRIYYGCDWGFANDPTALIRFYITEAPSKDVEGHTDQFLWVTHEAFGYQVEIDHLPTRIFEQVPGSKEWPIKADNARPETISYIRRRGYTIDGAEKWEGCVEDGIEHMKGFKRIYVHPRCEHLIREFKLYAYKVDPLDKVTVLPIIVDKHNHGIDAIRYGLDGVIQHRGGASMWRRLAGG